MDLHYGSGGEYLSDATFLERTSAAGWAETEDDYNCHSVLNYHYPQTVSTLQELPNCPQSAQK